MRILFIGGDMRMNYAADCLSDSFETARLGLGDYPAVKGKFGAVVLPCPLCKNGCNIFAPLSREPLGFPEILKYAEPNAIILAGGENAELSRICGENSLKLENYFSHEALTLKNAALTAEAALAILSQSTEGALLESEVLITGYGRIARYLAARLKAMGCRVTIAARREDARAAARLDGFYAVSFSEAVSIIGIYDYIVNTVPSALFTDVEFSAAKKGCVYEELATLAEEPIKTCAEHCGLKYIYSPGLPGKYSPQKAGEYIALEIKETLKFR